MPHLLKDAEKLATAPVRDYYEAKGFWKGVRATVPFVLLGAAAGAVVATHLAPRFEQDGCPVCKIKDAVVEKGSELLSQFDKATSPATPAPEPAPAPEATPAAQ